MTNIESELQTICNWYRVRIEQLIEKSVKMPHYRKSIVVLKEDFEKAVIDTIANHIKRSSELDKTKARIVSAGLSRIASESICKLFEPAKMKLNPQFYINKMEEIISEVENRVYGQA